MKHLLPFNKSIHYLLSAWITVMILLATSSAAAQTVYIGSAQITETLGASPTYYTYSESTGSSVLTPTESPAIYNVAVFMGIDSVLHLTLKDIKITKASSVSFEQLESTFTTTSNLYIDYDKDNNVDDVSVDLTFLGADSLYQMNGLGEDKNTICGINIPGHYKDTVIITNKGTLAIIGEKVTAQAVVSSGIASIKNMLIDNQGSMKITPSVGRVVTHGISSMALGIKGNGITDIDAGINKSVGIEASALNVESGEMTVQGNQAVGIRDAKIYADAVIVTSENYDGSVLTQISPLVRVPTSTKYFRILTRALFVGNALLNIPETDTKYYTYSETTGNSVLNEAQSTDPYNVAVSVANDKTLKLILKNINITKNNAKNTISTRQSKYGTVNIHQTDSSALRIDYKLGNVSLLLLGNNTLIGLGVNNSGERNPMNEYNVSSTGISYEAPYTVNTTGKYDVNTYTYKINITNEGAAIIKGGANLDGTNLDNSEDASSFAIHVGGDLDIVNKGQLNLQGADDEDMLSYGIETAGNLYVVNTGMMTAQGASSAISANKLTFDDIDKYHIIASSAYNGTPPTEFLAGDFSRFKFLQIAKLLGMDQIHIGTAPLEIPSSASPTYYTYSENSGYSALIPTESATDYNVAASVDANQVLHLTLKDITITKVFKPLLISSISSSYNIFLPYEGNVELTFLGNDSLYYNPESSSMPTNNYGIYSSLGGSDTLHIINKDALVVKYSSLVSNDSYGIRTNAYLDIDNQGTIMVNCQDEDEGTSVIGSSYGIYSLRSIGIKGSGLMSVEGNKLDKNSNGRSIGIYAGEDLAIESGTVMALGNYDSKGIGFSVYGNMVIKSGVVMARGNSYAIALGMSKISEDAGNLDLSQYTNYVGDASVSYMGENITPYDADNIDSYKYLMFYGNTIFVGDAALSIPAIGTKYYTYSEMTGRSVLAETQNSKNYNVAVSVAEDKTLNLTMNNIKVTKNSLNLRSNYNMSYNSIVSSALYINYLPANTVLRLAGNNTFQGADAAGYTYQQGSIHRIIYSPSGKNLIDDLGKLYTMVNGICYSTSYTTTSVDDGGLMPTITTKYDHSLEIDNPNGILSTIGGKFTGVGDAIRTVGDAGIQSFGEIILMNDGTMNLLGGSTESPTGLYAAGTATIKGSGVLTAAGINAESFGIFADSLSIESGTVTMMGKVLASFKAPNLSKYVDPIVQASADYSGTPLTSYNPADIHDYKFLHIEKAKVIDLSRATVTLSNNSFEANGSPQKPSVTVILDGNTLIEGTDFTVTYQHNVEPGTATVIIMGKGGYSGSQTITFTIYAKPVYVIIPKVEGVSVTPGFGLNLAGIGQPFEFTVTPDESLGKEGTDYTLEVRTDKGETLTPNGTSYKIAAIDHETTVYIIVKKLATGMESINALTVYGGQGSITILSPSNTTALVVNLTGKVVASTKLVSGKTTFSGLAKGIYIVKVGTETTKVVVK